MNLHKIKSNDLYTIQKAEDINPLLAAFSVFTDTQRAYTPIVATRGGIGLTAADLQELNKGSSKTTNKSSKKTNSKTKTNKELLTNKNTGLKVNITKKKK